MIPSTTTSQGATLVDVEARTVRIPVRRPVQVPGGTIDERWYTVVRVRADDDSIGIGWCYVGSRPSSIATQAVREIFAPTLEGRDGAAIGERWNEMYGLATFAGRSGLVMRALSAVDIALWDRAARAAGVALWQYLGGHCDTTRTYASAGYYDGSSPDELADQMRVLTEQGFDAVKIRVGRLPVEKDTCRIAAVCDAIGPGVDLMLDATCSWSVASSASHALEAWAPFEPTWIEEPFSPDEVDLLTQLAQESTTPIATGENESGRWRFRELARSGVVSVLQPDATVCGGITEFSRIVEIAELHDLAVAPHWFAELHVQLAAAFDRVSIVEWLPPDGPLNFGELLSRSAQPLAGRLAAPSDPGLGIDFDPVALEHFALDGWS